MIRPNCQDVDVVPFRLISYARPRISAGVVIQQSQGRIFMIRDQHLCWFMSNTRYHLIIQFENSRCYDLSRATARRVHASLCHDSDSGDDVCASLGPLCTDDVYQSVTFQFRQPDPGNLRSQLPDSIVPNSPDGWPRNRRRSAHVNSAVIGRDVRYACGRRKQIPSRPAPAHRSGANLNDKNRSCDAPMSLQSFGPQIDNDRWPFLAYVERCALWVITPLAGCIYLLLGTTVHTVHTGSSLSDCTLEE